MNSQVFKNTSRKIYILTSLSNDSKKKFFKKKGIKVINFSQFKDKVSNTKKAFKTIKKLGYSRVFVESGSSFLNHLLKFRLINNLFLFKSSKKLFSNGQNNSSILHIKKVKISNKNKIKVNLGGDSLYRVKF